MHWFRGTKAWINARLIDVNDLTEQKTPCTCAGLVKTMTEREMSSHARFRREFNPATNHNILAHRLISLYVNAVMAADRPFTTVSN
ncbi:hypothetical protein N7513_001930 [Penicillium frequentans]|nr:hypothetical protein N7513_001930 [Penicillium glabrum]